MIYPLYETCEHNKFDLNPIEVENLSWISHWHDDIELALLLSGTATVNINDNIFNIQAGTVCVINSHDIHCCLHHFFVE
jgi:mannose-6-phosphate isomerase-like protein (cupin superfamily)